MSSFRDALLKGARQKNSRVILALDVKGRIETRLRRAITILGYVHDKVVAVKINFHLLLPFGLQGLRPVLEYCKSKGLPTIADVKLNDIASTNEEVASLLTEYGFSAITANPIAGFSEGLEGLVKFTSSGRLGLILLVYMSHKGAAETYSLEFLKSTKLYMIFADRAREWKADGVIISSIASRVIREVRKKIGTRCLIFTPGIGVQGGDAAQAISNGSDFIIVGRSIVDSSNPLKYSELYRTAAPFYL